jgi:hypothetical protein
MLRRVASTGSRSSLLTSAFVMAVGFQNKGGCSVILAMRIVEYA